MKGLHMFKTIWNVVKFIIGIYVGIFAILLGLLLMMIIGTMLISI